ncbi:MAG: hypothetical protein KGN00_05020 [Chloroflexota bacterium]|nr:hypothetical protein [Chloroflexota bacterium]MDE3193030.1 hypothetical protein [Chloroflexota bacterium]
MSSDLNVRAVVIGALVDTIGTLIVGLLFDAAVSAAYAAPSPDALAAMVYHSVPLQLAQLALGLALTAIGAYVAAHIAKKEPLLHAFAVGVISTAIGFIFVFSAPEGAPFWAEAAGLLLTIPAAFVGGQVRHVLAGDGETQA